MPPQKKGTFWTDFLATCTVRPKAKSSLKKSATFHFLATCSYLQLWGAVWDTGVSEFLTFWTPPGIMKNFAYAAYAASWTGLEKKKKLFSCSTLHMRHMQRTEKKNGAYAAYAVYTAYAVYAAYAAYAVYCTYTCSKFTDVDRCISHGYLLKEMNFNLQLLCYLILF
jgi:hypothetical protein